MSEIGKNSSDSNQGYKRGKAGMEIRIRIYR